MKNDFIFQETILKMTKDLSIEEYFSLTMEILKQTPCNVVQQNMTKNFIVDNLSKWRKEKVGGQDQQRKERPVSRQPHPVDLGTGPSSSSKAIPLPFPKVTIVRKLLLFNLY